jgi:hypothetical protein
MKKALAYIGISSSAATTIINLIPDTVTSTGIDNHIGLKVLLFILFGVVAFGLSWTIRNVHNLLEGVSTGIVVGIIVGLLVAGVNALDTNLIPIPGYPDYYNFNHSVFVILKWVIPLVAYTYFGVVPWKN